MSFTREQIPFLGHVISGGQLAVDSDKLSRLKEWKPPLTTPKQVRQLVGFLSYYRAFIPNFAALTAPLTALLRKNATWRWSEEALMALEASKDILWTACRRYAWDPKREDRVTTDASGVAIAGTFEQRVEGVGWAPTAFWSRKLSEAERRYSTTDQEWLAVVEAVTRQWRHWLRGRRFVLRSDHGALKELLTKKGEQFSNRQFRWFERLQDFTFEFQHLPGTLNAAADALSRDPQYCVSALELRHQTRQLRDLGREELKEAAKEDPSYLTWKERIGRGEDTQERGWEVEDELIMDAQGRIAVPNHSALRTRIILEAHETPFSGHLGGRKTQEQVERVWWWSTIGTDVKRVVSACDVCQRSAGRGRKQEAPYTPIVASRPWEVVTMDFLSGFLPSTPGAWKGCVVVCDRFSRMMHVRECHTHPSAKEASRLFISLVVRAYGIPTKVITDRGTQFESVLWQEVMQMMGTRVALATTHHPQTNGLTERMNRTLIAMIRKVCWTERSKWVEALPLLEFAYNNSVHRSTGVAPFEACQGNKPTVPATLLMPERRGHTTPSSFAEQTRATLRRLHLKIQQAEREEQRMTKAREDQR